MTLAITSAATLAISMAILPVAHAAASSESKVATSTARIQSLLDNPSSGTVNLPTGTYTVSPSLRLSQGEKIVGHQTTLKVAGGSGDYQAMLAGTSLTTDLSGLAVTGVTFDQNNTGNPITSLPALTHGQSRFVILIGKGTGLTITSNTFKGTDNVNTVVTGSATKNVTISQNTFQTIDSPMHDHSSIYTSGTGALISGNVFHGTAAYATAIETHGDQAVISGNRISGYYKAANITSSNTSFTDNHVTGAANPVDLWSCSAPGLHDVTVSGNVLNRNLGYWKKVLANLGRAMPAAQYTQQVTKDPSSTFPFTSISIHGNTN
jgi:hypothetical protein